ncbi:MAG: hypothetical protein IAI48_17165 [Candidatus Eremiobacteraeota bacterium]|nr:hypothetical protein [Candidatus Eremiobacteraeota bacterium]
MFVRIVGAVLLLATVTATSPVDAAAAGTNPYLVALAKYWKTKFDEPVDETMKNVRVTFASSVALPCSGPVRCRRPGRAFLVSFREGDGGGQALEFRKRGAPCSDCITSVAIAGGGVLSRPDVMSYGLTAAQAAVLIPHPFVDRTPAR